MDGTEQTQSNADGARQGAVATLPGDPHRRLQLKLDLQADDLRSIIAALDHIALDIERQGLERRQVVSGGWSSGYYYYMTCDPEQDGDNYRAQLKDLTL